MKKYEKLFTKHNNLCKIEQKSIEMDVEHKRKEKFPVKNERICCLFVVHKSNINFITMFSFSICLLFLYDEGRNVKYKRNIKGMILKNYTTNLLFIL